MLTSGLQTIHNINISVKKIELLILSVGLSSLKYWLLCGVLAACLTADVLAACLYDAPGGN